MTSRRPRRRRRERASTLPRPSGGPAIESSARPADSAALGSRRERHTKTDYSYVRKDLVAVAAVGFGTLAFVVVMAFVL